MYFNSSPQILPLYETTLKLDKNVVRYLITNSDLKKSLILILVIKENYY